MSFKNKQILDPNDIARVPKEFEQEHKKRNIFWWPSLILCAIIILLTVSCLYYIFHVLHSTVSHVSHPKTVTVKPTPVPPHLESPPYRITINVKQGDTVDTAVKQQIESDKQLEGRKIGLVIIYTGAPTTDDVDNARKIDEDVKKLLQSLKTNNFAQALYYNSQDQTELVPSTDLYALTKPASFIVLDLYLYNNEANNPTPINSHK